MSFEASRTGTVLDYEKMIEDEDIVGGVGRW